MAEQFNFHRSLYLPDAVEAAATAHSEYAKIEVTTSAEEVVAVLSDVIDHDPDLVAKSFCNHALYETIVRVRRATPEKA